jgi:hypothetical protein
LPGDEKLAGRVLRSGEFGLGRKTQGAVPVPPQGRIAADDMVLLRALAWNDEALYFAIIVCAYSTSITAAWMHGAFMLL